MTSTANHASERRMPVRVVMVGHVDHGKSTLLGRLLCDTGSIPASRCEAVRNLCEASGKPFEYAFLLDALEEEREQGITIDTMQVKFRSSAREYIIIDAPGHKEFLKNMVTGAASADAAMLVIDAFEGVQEQTKRHGLLLRILGLRQIIVVVNKMDLVEYSKKVFEDVRDEYREFLAKLNIAPKAFIPAAARDGANVTTRGDAMKWYDGPTVLEAMDALEARRYLADFPLRMPVQDVYKFDHRRIVAGRVGSGRIAAGDVILFSPSGSSAMVRTIERWNSSRSGPAFAGESIGITLSEQLFVERGQIISHKDNPPVVTSQFQAQIFWLGRKHLVPGRDYILKLATQEVRVQVASVDEVIETSTLAAMQGQSEVACNEVARVTLSTDKPIALDVFGEFEETGRFVIVDGFDVAGGGVVLAAVQAAYAI